MKKQNKISLQSRKLCHYYSEAICTHTIEYYSISFCWKDYHCLSALDNTHIIFISYKYNKNIPLCKSYRKYVCWHMTTATKPPLEEERVEERPETAFFTPWISDKRCPAQGPTSHLPQSSALSS